MQTKSLLRFSFGKRKDLLERPLRARREDQALLCGAGRCRTGSNVSVTYNVMAMSMAVGSAF